MRFYFNPCYTTHSFDKSGSRNKSNRDNIMTTSNGTLSQLKDSSNSSRLSEEEDRRINSVKLNCESFDASDTHTPEDPLAIEFRENDVKSCKRRRRFLICCVAAVFTLIIIAGIIAYVSVHLLMSNKTPTTNCISGDCQLNGKSIKEKSIGNGLHEKHPTVSIPELDNEKVCTTEQCKLLANNLKNTMNFTADPCEDFYEFACGLWEKTHPLPNSMPKLDTMALLNLNKNIYLKNTVESELAKMSSLKTYRNKILKFYKTCKDLDEIDERGKLPLLKLISSLGKWSPLKLWSEGEVSITELLVKSHQYFVGSVYDDRNKSPLFKAMVKVNDANSNQHILELNLPDLPISDATAYVTENEHAENIRAKYKLLQTNYVALLGPATNAEKSLDELFKFEVELANKTIQLSSIRNIFQEYNLTTIKQMTEYVGDEIDWLKLIQGFFKDVPDVHINENTQIGVRSIKYFKVLNDFVKERPKQIVKDYIIWVCVWRYGYYASSPFREANFNFEKALIGIQERPERWNQCIEDIEETMEFGLAALYVEKALTDTDKRIATEIVKNITNEFRRNLVNVEWMDVGTKAKAFSKVNSITENIGYPDYVKNETYLNIKYNRIVIQNGKYFENALEIYKDKRISNLMLLNQPVDNTAYDLPPTLVEAYFDPNKNKMVFLAGILNVPFYDSNGPMALNYGALGLVVGHEVTHAFDDLGRLFDENGEKVDWWSESSTEAFLNRSQCIIDQYENYTIHGVNVNGRLTLGENIADNGGIKVAYLAYKEWERKHGKEKSLPGIQLTMDQLLFVSHGQVWCGAYREEYIKQTINTDYHSPAKFRIIGPLSNLKEFSEAFKCPLGSKMNPVKKCRVW